MIAGLYTSGTAMETYQNALDVTANNIANANTTAFKSSEVTFEDLYYSGQLNDQVGHGVRVGSTNLGTFSQGTINPTGRDLDLAIDGIGLFAVKLPDGTINYTRDGSFQQDGLGRLVTSQGLIVQPQITFPANTKTITISSSGAVSITTGSSSQPTTIGQLQLVNFPNTAGLLPLANNLYSETPNSGAAISGIPGVNGLGSLQQDALEQSNVNVTEQMVDLATEQQAFTVNSRALSVTNSMLTSALGLVQ